MGNKREFFKWTGYTAFFYLTIQSTLAAVAYFGVRDEDKIVKEYVANGGFREELNSLEKMLICPGFLIAAEIASKN